MTETQETVGVGVSLAFLVGLGDKLEREHQWRVKHSDLVFQMPIIGALSGSGTMDGNVPQMAPPREHCWSVRWISVTGFSAGTATVLINGIETYLPVAQPGGLFTFGRGEFLLQPGDRIVINATGITGNVALFGRADTFPYFYLRHYLD